MNRLTYQIYKDRLFLTDYFGDETDECEILVKECMDAGFSIGSERLKIKNGVGRVKLSEIKKGKYTPMLILDMKTISGEDLEIGGPCVKISPVCDAAKIEAAKLMLLKRLDSAEREISALKDSVYGKTIF